MIRLNREDGMKITVEMEPSELLELFSQATTFTERSVTEVRTSREVSSKEIRAWAKSKRIPISNKGYIPKDVKELYDAHH